MNRLSIQIRWIELHPVRTVAVALALALWQCGHASAADIQVVAPNAVKQALAEVAVRFERESGHRVLFTWTGSEDITKRVTLGEPFDVVINAAPNVDRHIADGKVSADSRIDFAKSGIGVAVHAGLPRPDVSTTDGLRRALLDASSIAISSGTSGRYMESLFLRLGIADQLKRKITQPPSGTQIAALIARGDASLGFQQVAELRHADGIAFLGPLPADLQNYTIWTAAVHSSSAAPDVGLRLIKAFKSVESSSAFDRAGMEPI